MLFIYVLVLIIPLLSASPCVPVKKLSPYYEESLRYFGLDQAIEADDICLERASVYSFDTPHIWRYKGIDTCIRNGPAYDLCDDTKYACGSVDPESGLAIFGFSRAQARRIRETIDNCLYHPDCKIDTGVSYDGYGCNTCASGIDPCISGSRCIDEPYRYTNGVPGHRCQCWHERYFVSDDGGRNCYSRDKSCYSDPLPCDIHATCYRVQNPKWDVACRCNEGWVGSGLPGECLDVNLPALPTSSPVTSSPTRSPTPIPSTLPPLSYSGTPRTNTYIISAIDILFDGEYFLMEDTTYVDTDGIRYPSYEYYLGGYFIYRKQGYWGMGYTIGGPRVNTAPTRYLNEPPMDEWFSGYEARFMLSLP